MSNHSDSAYEFAVHHSEEDGKKMRKKIWFYFWVLLAITTVEVGLGLIWKNLSANPENIWGIIKTTFIILTLFKAFFIVWEYMHLGHERKNLKWTILAPYIIFVLYLTFICLNEALAIRDFDFMWWNS